MALAHGGGYSGAQRGQFLRKKGETVEDIKLNSLNIDRRSFVAAGVVAAAALGASGSLYGCDNRLSETSGSVQEEADAPLQQADGEWKTIACLHGCGTRCMNQALVKDGVVIRQKTDDTHEDSIECPQQRGCLRGRSLVEFEMGADRIKYPLKRISWTPEDPNGDLRGKEGYERISWDEALDFVAGQLKRVYTEYGPRAILCPIPVSVGGKKDYGPLLTTLGGYMQVSDTISYGTYTGNTDLLGLSWGGELKVNDRMDMIQNSDVIVLHAMNPGWGSNGNPAYFFRAAKDNGAQVVFIGPENNVTSSMLDAKWIPVKPGTDTALFIAVAREMLRLDEEKGDIVDWDFVHTYCVGLDAESMPEGAATSENYRGYLLGEYDGIEKNAAWASAICGTPESDIIWLAETVGKKANVGMFHGYAAARCNGAEDLPQAYMAVACLGGHFGKPGNACGNLYVDRQGPGGDQIVATGSDGVADIELPELPPLFDATKVEAIADDDYVDGVEIWDLVLTGEYNSVGRAWSGVFKQPEKKKADIHMIYGSRDGSARSVPNNAKMAEAMRKVDFVLMQHFTTTPSLAYADIILPLVSNIERDQVVASGDRDREVIFVYSKIGETAYEGKTPQWINEQLLERLGYNPKDVYPLTETQQFFNQLSGSEVLGEDGSATPLVTITEEDIAAWGVDGMPQEGLIGLEELRKRGSYQVTRSFDDAFNHIAYADFIEDPNINPLDSASGKFEFYCQAKADQFNKAAMGGESYKPYATYHEQPIEEGYPLLVFNTHYPRSACSDFDNVVTLRETFEAPVTISTADAKERGISDGDPVIVSSAYGTIVRKASVSPLIIPGAVDVPNGSWTRFDANGFDRGGNPNTLYGGAPRGMGVSGYNNVCVQVEKWTGEDLEPDSETQLIIEGAE